MSTASVQLVQTAYQCFATRDAAKLLSLFSPEIEIVQSTEVPWGGVFHGHDGAQQFFGTLTRYINSTLEIERWLDAGDHVVAMGWTQGTVNATGAKYRVPIAHVWKVHAGRVQRIHFLIDNPTMQSALAAG
jgi:ketosteroid isomerase-like protein